jgi:MFS transporter, DHA1 family, multidrug resistance protein
MPTPQPKAVPRSGHALSDFQFVLLLGAMSMIGPIAIDTLFPAFPVASHALGVSRVALQQTVSFYLFGFAAGCLLHGPLSDAYGRRPILLVCMFCFVFASVGAWLAPDLHGILLFRALQGFFAAGGTVISRALVRDRFEGPMAQKATSQITLVFLLGPAIAPIIGGAILQVAPWRMIFGVITIYSALVACALTAFLRESHPLENRSVFRPGALFQGYGNILKDRSAVLLIAAAMFNFAGLFLFIASAPAIVFGLWKLTELELWKLFVFATGGIFCGSQLSGYVATRWSPARSVNTGYKLMAAGCILHIAYGYLITRPLWPGAGVPLLVYATGSALAFPALTVLLMDRFPLARGAAASVQTFASLFLNGVVAGVISPLVSSSTLGLALTQAALAFAGLAAWWSLRSAGAFVLTEEFQSSNSRHD